MRRRSRILASAAASVAAAAVLLACSKREDTAPTDAGGSASPLATTPSASAMPHGPGHPMGPGMEAHHDGGHGEHGGAR